MQIISAQQIQSVLDWKGVLDAMLQGHSGPRPMGGSYFIGDADYGLFSRGVVLPEQGAGIKIASIHPANVTAQPPLPSEQAAFLVLDECTKGLVALLDGPEITRWKTAADSALAARILSSDESQVLLVLGAGPVARSLINAYLHIRPSICEVLLWNRTPSRQDDIFLEIKERGYRVSIVKNIDAAVSRANIIVSATSSSTPLIRGEYVRPGTHVDLVGGYRPDMQEADCDVFRGARIFVDDRQSAAHSGDIQIPVQQGVIQESDIEGDLFDICRMSGLKLAEGEHTVYKNAGGAHLDLIVSQYVVQQLKLRQN